jgi:hypothetical protein
MKQKKVQLEKLERHVIGLWITYSLSGDMR